MAELQRVEKRVEGPPIGPATKPTPSTLQQVSDIIIDLQAVTKETEKIQKRGKEYVEVESATLTNIIEALERARGTLQTDTTTGLLTRISADVLSIKEKMDKDAPPTPKT